MEDSTQSYFALAVPRTLVKKVKDPLNTVGRLDKSISIRPRAEDDKLKRVYGNPTTLQGARSLVPVTEIWVEDEYGVEPLSKLLSLIGMQENETKISLVVVFPGKAMQRRAVRSQTNLIALSIQQWLQRSQPRADSASVKPPEAGKDVDSFNWTYMIYSPLLLLPASFLSNLSSIQAANNSLGDLSSLYILLCQNFEITHIALNAPIPRFITDAPDVAADADPIEAQHLEHEPDPHPNVLRSPTGLTPLYGDFGPVLSLESEPTSDDFDTAFWCTAQQNGVFQTWAPRYTMFSRGNISEKARILKLKSLTMEVLGIQAHETCAVDLYAGIGYFAFSYAKAGVGKVLCWEINPWSVEGLRRGAERNKWRTGIVQDRRIHGITTERDERLIIYQESNKHAAAVVEMIRHRIPPVRHVNCGLLPSSEDSWETAIKVIDPMGGWIHVHENIAKKDIKTRKEEIVETFRGLLRTRCSERTDPEIVVKCEHIEKVKSYAPGIIHCVLDIALKHAK